MFIYVHILPVEPRGLILPMTILGTVYEIGFTYSTTILCNHHDITDMVVLKIGVPQIIS